METKSIWRVVYEDTEPMWVYDLDSHIYGTDHRRLCVWLDQTTGNWCWEIETYVDLGQLAHGISTDKEAAMNAAIGAAARLTD